MVEPRGETTRRLRLRVGHAGVQLGGDVPVAGAAERHPLAFTLTMMRVATDCTRPADSFGATFFHSTGLTS